MHIVMFNIDDKNILPRKWKAICYTVLNTALNSINDFVLPQNDSQSINHLFIYLFAKCD